MSWWGREVRIWRVPTLLSGTSGFPRVDYPDATQKRKLVAVVGVKVWCQSIWSRTNLLKGCHNRAKKVSRRRQFQRTDLSLRYRQWPNSRCSN